MVSRNGVKTSNEKVKDIINYKTPSSLRGLSSFLGLSDYYRKFVRDYVAIVKSLTRRINQEM